MIGMFVNDIILKKQMGNLGRLKKITQYYFMLLRNGLAGMPVCSFGMPEGMKKPNNRWKIYTRFMTWTCLSSGGQSCIR